MMFHMSVVRYALGKHRTRNCDATHAQSSYWCNSWNTSL